MRQPDHGALAGRVLNEQYVLIELLGVGGMAEVYHGDDLGLERDVAVKVLPSSASDDPALVARFRDEARRVAALSHPRIVPIYHLGDDDGLLYIVMPLMHGSLRDQLLREGTLPPAQAVRLIQQVAEALDAAHAAGIVHRDVKPENILIDADSGAHLSDFGIARSFAGTSVIPTFPSLVNAGIPAGTPQYMAPEQLASEPLDQRTDVYGLAAVLYELLAGEPPHGTGPLHEIIGRAIAGGIPPLAPRAPAVWPQLEAAIIQGLAHDRARRFQTVRDFSLALDTAMGARYQHTTTPADIAALPTIPAGGDSAYPATAANRPISLTLVSPDTSTIPLAPTATLTERAAAGPRRRVTLGIALAIFALLALLTTASGAYYLASTNAGSTTPSSTSALSSAAATATAHALGAGSSARGIASPTTTPPATTRTPSAVATTPAPTPGQTPTTGQLIASSTSASAKCTGTDWPSITLTDTGGQPVDWQGTSDNLSVTLSPSGGRLVPAATQQVTLQGLALTGTTVRITFTWSGPPQVVAIACQ